MSALEQTQVLIIGSGAGGAVTALELADAGIEVLVVEEGNRYERKDYGMSFTQALKELYRGRGMTPIQGRVPVGFVEGCCVGGSTEINSGFWLRPPPETLERWKTAFLLEDAGPEDLEPHFKWAEDLLSVRLYQKKWPASTSRLAQGAEALGWSYMEMPRVTANCGSSNSCPCGCPTGAKQGMSSSLLPRAEAAGARILHNCRVKKLIRENGRVSGAIAEVKQQGSDPKTVRIHADHVFLCAGAMETPALLWRSEIRSNVGDSLNLHPMIKVLAKFKDPVNGENNPIPLIQIKEFSPDVNMGGSYCSLSQIAMILSDNWPQNRDRIREHEYMACYCAATRGTGIGRVRPSSLQSDKRLVHYRLEKRDLANLAKGLASLCQALLAGGAVELFPSVHGIPSITKKQEAIQIQEQGLKGSDMSLTTVHAFCSCPIGGREDRSAADSFGKIRNFLNLYINDASMLPDSPGANPQAITMALARRNAIHFKENLK